MKRIASKGDAALSFGAIIGLVTALNPYIGYDKATEIVKEAAASGRSLREVAREAGVDEETLDKALDYRAMAEPHDKAASLDTTG